MSESDIKETKSSPLSLGDLVSPLSKSMYEVYKQKYLPLILELETNSNEGIDDLVSRLEKGLTAESVGNAIVYHMKFGGGSQCIPSLVGQIQTPDTAPITLRLSNWIPTVMGGTVPSSTLKQLPSILKILNLQAELERKHPGLFDFKNSTVFIWNFTTYTANQPLHGKMELSKIKMNELKTKEEYMEAYLQNTLSRWIPYAESIYFRLTLTTRMIEDHVSKKII